MKRLVAFALAAAAAAYLSASPVMAEGLTGCCKKPLRAEASQLTDGLHHLKKPLREARPSVTEQILACNQNLCHIKRPLVQTVADVQVEGGATPGDRKVSVKPLTSVVVTQCNLLVAAYITTTDGGLYRFDHESGVPASDVLMVADLAPKRERIEVNCDKIST